MSIYSARNGFDSFSITDRVLAPGALFVECFHQRVNLLTISRAGHWADGVAFGKFRGMKPMGTGGRIDPGVHRR